MLRLENAWKQFASGPTAVTALADASLDLSRGDFISITGPSGSGKSTLVTLLGLLDRPDQGRLTFMDQDVSRYSAGRLAALRRAHIGFVFQAFHLIQDMTVLENVMLGLEGLVRSRADRSARAGAVLERLGLSDRAGHLPSQLSGGQQQRAAIARAMAKEPDLLICDEPTGNLDGESGERVVELILALNKAGAAVALVTHDPRLAEMAERRFHIADGRLTAPLEIDNL